MSAEAADGTRLNVVLAWHMHQPQYKDLASGTYRLPWTYLHAIKDYTDMAAHIEAAPQARVVVNFAPLLLEQIADYTAQVEGFLRDGRAITDPLLAALGQPVLPASYEERLMLIKGCLRAHETRMIQRFPAYQRLADMAAWAVTHPGVMGYLRDQYLVDLLVWYHLAWLGETVRRTDISVRRLIEKEGGYTLNDRRELLDVIGGLLAGVIPRYARLADSGRVELSVTPYAHPIVPLLIDVASAREAMPQAMLPMAAYPGGAERARWHVREGLAAFERHFGFRPAGCWPSEGGVSTAALKLLSEEGIRWAATGEAVLAHSLTHSEQPPTNQKESWLYRPYQAPAGDVRVFFRDDGLSDLIGFTYASWHADDAVADLIAHLVRIADACRGQPNAVVSIILDGENAWEHYPENGYYFLSALHRRLAEHPRLHMTTFSDCLTAQPAPLPAMTGGSWVYGTFSTWIGDTDKNRGWDMLTDAKRAYDAHVERLAPAQRELATRQLAICEGSDWFWWFGDYNPQATVSDFERLYRLHLTNLYQVLRLAPPEYLAHVFTRGSGAPEHGGTMRKN
jgi:alpha-amylase/alpha-mannosidase (GH57 family)